MYVSEAGPPIAELVELVASGPMLRKKGNNVK